VKEEDVPHNFLDILDPKWKGKMVLTIPNDDDAIGYLFSLAIQRYGWAWLHALKEQDVQWVRGTATPGYVIAENNDPSLAGGKTRPKEYAPNNSQRV
jgi:ABC-type Fe3+ transport system substrate-binding protein